MSQLAPLMPYHRVNILTGTRTAKLIEDPAEYAKQITKAERPLLVLGPRLSTLTLGGRLLLDYAMDIAKAKNIPTCATATLKSKMVELGGKPDSVYDIVEIINALKDPDWKGVRKEGIHDLVIFFGFRTELGNQGLSVLKHFAPHLKTMILCKYYYPHADFSLPNIRKDEQWEAFLENLIDHLRTKGGD
jgi:acetyl-CoA decarbonylase/synthase complex subunit epsilon